jgi:hypothetical protein
MTRSILKGIPKVLIEYVGRCRKSFTTAESEEVEA